MTDNQAQILKEIRLYNDRMGRWPTISALSYIMGRNISTTSLNLKRMAGRGYVEYVGEWENGQTRQVKACDI